jgi:hypothetical protein
VLAVRRALAIMALTAVLVTTIGSAATAGARAKFRVSSPAFAAGREIPEGFTCTGANANPPLRWRNLPDGAVELALVMDDPDAPSGTFVHWVAWGIDPEAGALPEQAIPAGVVQGSNGTGSATYLGPCPPPGDGPHRYRFTVFAVDEPVELASGAPAAELRDAIAGTVVAKARLVGRYER